MLVAITEGQEHAALASFPALAAVARAEQATVRLAYFRPLPAPRVDAHDRVVASVEVEMERLAAAAVDALGAAARAFDDIVIEPVVRFGKPGREVLLEAEALATDLVILVAPHGVAPLARLRAWRLRRRLARRGNVRVLVLQRPARERRLEILALPRWQERMAGPPR